MRCCLQLCWHSPSPPQCSPKDPGVAGLSRLSLLQTQKSQLNQWIHHLKQNVHAKYRLWIQKRPGKFSWNTKYHRYWYDGLVTSNFKKDNTKDYDMDLAMGDRFRLFIQTLNNDKKPFNSIFNSKTKSNYSFKEFIHSKTKSNYSFKEFIHSKIR